jgi:hypothetical protein
MTQTPTLPIEQALTRRDLLGAALGNDLSTWATWFACVKAAYGRRLARHEFRLLANVAGGRLPPRHKVKEFVAAISRRAGKGRMAGALLVYESCLVDHSQHLSPGEPGVCACISPTTRQAKIVLRYARGFFESSPLLRNEVAEVTADEIRLHNGNIITTLTQDFRSLRGHTLLIAILDEAAFLRDETSATPDIEAARALLPSLLTTNGMLCVLSSPYRRAGLLHQRHKDFHGKNDADVLVVGGSSVQFNPTLNAERIAAATAADPQGAIAEWEGQFRSDLAQFLDDDLIDAATDHDRPLELPPRSEYFYICFVDMSAGRHDASTICIMHAEGSRDQPRYIVDVIRGHRAPHDPAIVAQEFAALAKQYRCAKITGDAFAGEWVSGTFRNAGSSYVTAELPRSGLYLEGLPLFSRGQVSFPEHKQLIRELRCLERSTHRSGKDSVDHPKGAGASDDYANSLFGALWCRAAAKQGITRANIGAINSVLARLGPSRDSFNQIHGASSMYDLVRQGRA